MSPKPQQAQLAELYVTPGQLQMRDWHQVLYKFALVCAIVMIFGSYVALQWATYFIGLRAMPGSLPGMGYFAVGMSLILPLAIEGGMAIIASAFTTIPTGTRIDAITGELRKVPKKLLLGIFSFLMSLAQASNIGHAMVAVNEALTAPDGPKMPPFMPDWAIYGFAGALAMLMPLGGTFMVYVAGFIREHGVGADWIDEETEKVHVQVSPFGAAAMAQPAPQRAPRRQPAPTTPAPAPAPTVQAPAPRPAADAVVEARTAPLPTRAPAPARMTSDEATVFEQYRADRAAGNEWTGKQIAEQLGYSEGAGRKIRSRWNARLDSELAIAGGQRPELDLDDADADQERATA